MACRRAISVAQLTGFRRSNSQAQYEVLDSGTNYDTRAIWSRIIFLDRFLCLLLGLPKGYAESKAGSEPLKPRFLLVLHCGLCFVPADLYEVSTEHMMVRCRQQLSQ